MADRGSAREAGSKAVMIVASLAAALGLGHAAVSAYWAVGGTWLLDTIGGEIERWGRERQPSVIVALWLVALLKAGVALAAPVLALGPGRLPVWTTGRAARALSWIAAVVLAGYGGVLTAVGLLVQGGVIEAAPESDQRALAWHAYLWDPWFFAWGSAFLVCLWLTRPKRAPLGLRSGG